MGKNINLKEATRLVWETVKISEENCKESCPYVFIVGAGVSVPEIVSAKGIIKHCKEKVEKFYADDENELKRIYNEADTINENSARYYSFWFENAYKNKIHRQEYLKKIIKAARISTSNLLLAQILNTKKIASTVITPNFDNQLLKSLNLLGNYNVFSAENELDNIALSKDSEDIQIMHVHGTYQFYDCCNLEQEIINRASNDGLKSTARAIEEFLKNQAPIVIGYSGWEDDVIMKCLKERLEYAIPYSIIWYCYSQKDFENLPIWLKSSQDVLFVVPDRRTDDENDKNSENVSDEEKYLPAEDICSALITKFGFEAPSLLRNPLQYYVELIDGFLPENENVFPTKYWKRKLDYIEEHFGDIEKEIIRLEEAAARKNIIDVKNIITNIIDNMEYSFISLDDLEHIFDGVIMPLINNKNRIEDQNDLYDFLNIVIELLCIRGKDILIDKVKLYIDRFLDFLDDHSEKFDVEAIIYLYDKIITFCKANSQLQVNELLALGLKSEVSTKDQKKLIEDEIIQRGYKELNNPRIAKLVQIAICRQIRNTKVMLQEQKNILDQICDLNKEIAIIQENHYYNMLSFYDNEIEIDAEIDDIIKEICNKNLPKSLVLHAKRLKCNHIESKSKKVEIAQQAIEEYDFDEITKCRECLDYAFLLKIIIENKIQLEERVEQKYITYSLKLCNKEEGCPIVFKVVINALDTYIKNIKSEYEIKELCLKISHICEKNKYLYDEWAYYCDYYFNYLDEKDKEEYLQNNSRYMKHRMAIEKVEEAIELYIKGEKNSCKELLLEGSAILESISDGEWNPALVNIAFMVRRGEIPEIETSALEILDRIDYMSGDAFYHINKALVYVEDYDWEKARKEISNIKYNVDDAIAWWNNQEVVGMDEKNIVFLLLLLQEIVGMNKKVISNEFIMECLHLPYMTDEVSKELEKWKTS